MYHCFLRNYLENLRYEICEYEYIEDVNSNSH